MSSSTESTHTFKCQGAIVTLKVKEGAMKAFLEMLEEPKEKKDPAPAAEFNYEKFETEVCDWIESILPAQMVDSSQLQNSLDLYRTTRMAKERRIAIGLESIPGADGKLIMLVKPYSKAFEGTYDIKNRFQKHFDIINKGAVVARLYPPKPGKDGINVFNKSIPFIPGKAAGVELIANLSVRESPGQSFNEVCALEDGYLQSDKVGEINKLSLETILRYPKGVDHNTGSVLFINAVHIAGDVKEGFVVEAVNDITVTGNTNQSNIVSKNGSIQIGGIVLDEDISDDSLIDFLKSGSQSQHSIRAAKCFKAKALQNAKVFAGETIEIEKTIIRSQVYSSSIVTCKGAIYASRISTACGLEVKQLGNESNIITIVEFLHPIEAGIEFVTKKQLHDRQKEKLAKLELFIGPYVQDPKNLNRLTAEHKNKIKLSISELKALAVSIEKVEKELLDMHSSSSNLKFSQLNVLDKCYTGVVIKADNKTYSFHEDKKTKFSLIFNWETKEFSFSEYQPIKCEII